MSEQLNANSIKRWLDSLEKDRHWLGEEIGISKRTLDNWFYADSFPEYAIKHIVRIMRELENKNNLLLGLEDWKLISSAAEAAGFDDVERYISEVLREHAKAERNKK